MCTAPAEQSPCSAYTHWRSPVTHAFRCVEDDTHLVIVHQTAVKRVEVWYSRGEHESDEV
ncbi:hypothetical protein EON67_06475 [archaeon]|nr:MAG: hypothetical protein EON67_06475 [archaeon]